MSRHTRSYSLFAGLVLAIAGICVLAPQSAPAATKTWTAPVDGSWSDGSKWTPPGAPADGDNVVIVVPGNYVVVLDVSRTLNTLMLGALSGTTTQTLNLAGQNLTVTNDSSIRRRGLVEHSAGTLAGASTLSVSGTYNWSGGTMTEPGKVSLTAAGIMNISGGAEKLLQSGRTINSSGNIQWTGAGIIHGRGGFINNLAGGLFEARNDSQMFVGGGEGDGGFTNAGTFRKLASSVVTTIGGAQGFTFTNTGRVEIKTGTLDLGASLTAHSNTGTIVGSPGTSLNFSGGTSNLTDGSIVDVPTVGFSGGTVNIGGSYTSDTTVINGGRADFNNPTAGKAITSDLTLTAGALRGTGALRVESLFDWVAGAVSGSGGNVTLPANATMNIRGDDTKSFFSYIINNGGTATWTGAGSIDGGGSGATFNNLQNALFDAQNDATMLVNGGNGNGFFTNAGIFRKSNSTGVTSFGGNQGFTFTNTDSGVLEIVTGTVRFDSALGSHISTGVVTGHPGTTLLFGSGTSDFTAGSVAVPTVTFSGGVANIGATYAATSTIVNGGTGNLNNESTSSVNVVLSAGNLGGSGIHNVTGDFDWTGGRLFGGNGTIVLGSGVVMNIDGSAEKGFFGQTLSNLGIIMWNGGDISGGSTAKLENTAQGIVEVRSDARMFVGNGLGDGFINNAGIFRKTGSTGTTQIGGPQGFLLTNTGRVEALSGTLQFTGVDRIPSFDQDAGTAVLQGGSLAGTLQFDGGKLIGKGTITGDVISNGATVAPGFSPGKLSIVGNYTQAKCAALEIEIAGLATPGTSFDQLNVSGSAQLAGTLQVSTIDGFKPGPSDTVNAVAAGTITGTFDNTNSQVAYSSNSAIVAARASIPGRLLNISTRLQVQSGNNVLIGGFIVTGTEQKKVIVRAIGPSLRANDQPLEGRLADPILELFPKNGSVPLATNDNWVDSPDKQAIIDSTVAPPDNSESAIVRLLQPGEYTAIVRGVEQTEGIGLVEAYDLNQGADSKLANISTRGFVQVNNDVMIGGIIVGGEQALRVIARAIGPSLAIEGKLANPFLELHNANGGLIASNDNWRTGGQEQEIIDTTVPPSEDAESALVQTLTPGNYTAIVSGVNQGQGIALVEVFGLGPPLFDCTSAID
jgi:hypothetical protein